MCVLHTYGVPATIRRHYPMEKITQADSPYRLSPCLLRAPRVKNALEPRHSHRHAALTRDGAQDDLLSHACSSLGSCYPCCDDCSRVWCSLRARPWPQGSAASSALKSCSLPPAFATRMPLSTQKGSFCWSGLLCGLTVILSSLSLALRATGGQAGHRAQASCESGGKLACYFNFNVNNETGCSGCITAEALFDLNAFLNANLVIAGGAGDFHGIRGNGRAQAIDNAPEGVATFVYNFSYDFTGGTKPVDRTCHVLANTDTNAVRARKM